MKAGWAIKALSDVCDVVNGGTPNTKVAEYWEGSHLWITPAEMGKRLSPYVENTTRKITDSGLRNSSARLLPPESVILSSRAPIGHLVINTKPMATNQGCKGLIPGNQLYYKYLYYFLSSIISLLESLGNGTTFKELSGQTLKHIKIPVPPLSEQQRIIHILDEAFAGIGKIKANTEKNVESARAIFNSYLNDIFSQKREGWCNTKLGNYIRFIDYRGRTPKKTSKGLRLITAKNVKMGYIDKQPEEFVAPDSYDSWMTRGIPERGDIIFTTEAPLANVAQLNTDEKVVFAQRIIIMHPDEYKLESPFLKYLLISKPIQQRIHENGTGATVKGIKASLLKLIDISFPDSNIEQLSISKQLDELSITTKLLESKYLQKLQKLEELKQSLLHQAFNGEL